MFMPCDIIMVHLNVYKGSRYEKKEKKGKQISVGTAVFMLVAGIILGSVFTFGMQYWNSYIKREDANRVEATYEKHAITSKISRRANSGAVVYFTDNDPLSIDSACINDDLREALDRLTKGTKAIMLVHPNSDTILDMRAGGQSILDFADTQRRLNGEKTGFLILGIFMYLCAAHAVYSLIRHYAFPAK